MSYNILENIFIQISKMGIKFVTQTFLIDYMLSKIFIQNVNVTNNPVSPMK